MVLANRKKIIIYLKVLSRYISRAIHIKHIQIIKHLQGCYVCSCIGFPSTPYPTERVLGQFWTRVNCQRPLRPDNRKHLWFSWSWQQCQTNSNPITDWQQGGFSSAWRILLLSTPDHRSIVPLFWLSVCLTCISYFVFMYDICVVHGKISLWSVYDLALCPKNVGNFLSKPTLYFH